MDKRKTKFLIINRANVHFGERFWLAILSCLSNRCHREVIEWRKQEKDGRRRKPEGERSRQMDQKRKREIQRERGRETHTQRALSKIHLFVSLSLSVCGSFHKVRHAPGVRRA